MAITKSVLKYFSQVYQGGFGPPPLTELVKIPHTLVPTYVSWRNIVILARVDEFHMQDFAGLVKQYRPGQLHRMAAKYKAPPMWLLKKITKMRHDLPPPETLQRSSGALNKDLQYARNNDLSSSTWTDKDSEAAKNFEKKISQWLIKQDIQYIEEEDLKEQQIRDHGRAIATPDFLLKKPIVLDGQTINWIDAKNYILFDSFLLEHVQKQAQRYNNLFGNGALIFSMGAVEDISIPSTLILDARKLPI